MIKSYYLNILAHRGLWYSSQEKNTLKACENALSHKYGIEIDIRDNAGTLIIAHDVNDSKAYPFVKLCTLLKNHPQCCAAINIKSCGLQKLLKNALRKHGINNYFTFDMATPDLLMNLRHGINSFTRQSDYEREPILYQETQGVWLDAFENDWGIAEAVMVHVKSGKNIAIVSPELHGRDHLVLWNKLKGVLQTIAKYKQINLYLCTDHPQIAHRFFNE